MGANNPRDVTSLDPRSLIGRSYVRDHYILLHTKYVRFVLMVSEKKIVLSFSHYKSMGANDLRDVVSLDPRDLIG